MRYFLDTNCLIGLVFAQDVWNPDAKRLFDTDNSLYTSETVLYEFCNKSPENNRDSASIEWGADEGVYGRIRNDMRMAQILTDQEIQIVDGSELHPETVSDIFIEKFEIDEEAQPRVRKHFQKTLSSNPSPTDARDAVREVVDTILRRSEEMKDKLEARLYLQPHRDESYPHLSDQLARHLHSTDVNVVCDAHYRREQGIVERLVTADKEVYEARDEIRAISGVRVQYLKDQFAGESN